MNVTTHTVSVVTTNVAAGTLILEVEHVRLGLQGELRLYKLDGIVTIFAPGYWQLVEAGPAVNIAELPEE